MSRAERALYTTYAIANAPSAALVDAFRGQSVYAEWLRSRKAMLKIGRTLFVHAGVDRWALHTHPADVNACVREWITHWQGLGPAPANGSRWVVSRKHRGGKGPLWTRSFKVPARGTRAKGAPSRKLVRAVLQRYGVTRLVVGHAPTRTRDVVLAHPHYGDAVVLIDTRIADARRGRMSAIAIEGDIVTPIYADDRGAGQFLETLEEAALGGTHDDIAPASSGLARAVGWLRGLFAK
jgi:hypothetical protein